MLIVILHGTAARPNTMPHPVLPEPKSKIQKNEECFSQNCLSRPLFPARSIAACASEITRGQRWMVILDESGGTAQERLGRNFIRENRIPWAVACHMHDE